MSQGTHETEIKLAIPDAETARRLLRTAGFRIARRRVFESNVILDTPKLALRKARTLLRVREAGGLATLTYKGRPQVSKHKSREELETRIADPRSMAAILASLGYRPCFRYEKYRTEFHQPGAAGVAMVDETPIGTYMELEGTPAWIDRIARRLGFAERYYITASYARLYQEWCERQRIKPANMVFKAGSNGSAQTVSAPSLVARVSAAR